MGASANERIALRIDTTADLRGVQAVRSETTALGQSAKAATDAAIAGETKLAASIEQVREAQARSNGDFEKFKRELASIVQGENALAAAATKATKELEKQAAVRPPLQGPTGPQLGPALPGTPAGGGAGPSRQLALAEMAAYRMEAERSNLTLAKTPPAARQAGNALGLLAASAATGTGSMSGLATAAGNVAQGLSTMTNNAKLAAGAAGIGALAASIGILIGLAIEAKKKLEEIPDGVINAGTSARIQNIENETDAIRQLALAREDAARKTAAVGRFGDEAGLQAAANANAKIEAIESRLVAIRRDANEKRLADQKAARERQLALNEAADKQLQQLENTHLDLYQRRTETATTATRLRINREFQERQKEIEGLKVSEQRKTDLLATAARVRGEQLAAADIDAARVRADAEITRGGESGSLRERVDARIRELERERDAAIKAGADVLTATAIFEQRKRKLHRDTAAAAATDAKTIINVLLASGNQQLHAIGAVGETIRRVVIGAQAAQAAVEAAIEAGKAIGSAAAGDFRGAGLHAAAAAQLGAAAALGAQEALGARTSAGGGGGGGGGYSGSEAGTFSPRGGTGAGGGVTVVLQTVSPASREVVSEISYQLNRGGVLKRPIPIAPTTGLTMAGGW